MDFVRRNKANGWRYFQTHFSQWWNCGNDDDNCYYAKFNFFLDQAKYSFLNQINISSKAFDHDGVFYWWKFWRNFLFLWKKMQWLAVICSCSPSKLWYLWWMSSCNCQYQFPSRGEKRKCHIEEKIFKDLEEERFIIELMLSPWVPAPVEIGP